MPVNAKQFVQELRKTPPESWESIEEKIEKFLQGASTSFDGAVLLAKELEQPAEEKLGAQDYFALAHLYHSYLGDSRKVVDYFNAYSSHYPGAGAISSHREMCKQSYLNLREFDQAANFASNARGKQSILALKDMTAGNRGFFKYLANAISSTLDSIAALRNIVGEDHYKKTNDFNLFTQQLNTFHLLRGQLLIKDYDGSQSQDKLLHAIEEYSAVTFSDDDRLFYSQEFEDAVKINLLAAVDTFEEYNKKCSSQLTDISLQLTLIRYQLLVSSGDNLKKLLQAIKKEIKDKEAAFLTLQKPLQNAMDLLEKAVKTDKQASEIVSKLQKALGDKLNCPPKNFNAYLQWKKDIDFDLQCARIQLASHKSCQKFLINLAICFNIIGLIVLACIYAHQKRTATEPNRVGFFVETPTMNKLTRVEIECSLLWKKVSAELKKSDSEQKYKMNL